MLSEAQLKSKCLSGEISPNSTEGAIWKLGAALGTVQTKSASKKSRSARSAKPAHVITLSEFERYWLKLSEDDRLKFLDSLDVVEVLAAKSLRAKLQNRVRVGANGQAKVLLLPAPAKSSTQDLVPAWDAATPDERKRLVGERGNEILTAV
jgi:hypothetical protein